MAPSGGCKSSSLELAFDPHVAADSLIRGLQKDAEAAYKKWEKSQRGRGRQAEAEDAPPQPLAGPAYILRTNPTMESIIRDLDRGRPCMTLALAEAGSAIENWSHSRNKAGTVASYNSLWGGEFQTHDRTSDGGTSHYLDGNQRFSLIFLCQLGYRSWFFDKATANGFAGRLLIQSADGWTLEDAQAVNDEVTPADDTAYETFRELIAGWRKELDDGAHLKPEEGDAPPKRRILRFTPEARSVCRSFRAECADRIQLLVDCEWPQAFLARGPEHACRIAAVLFAYRQRADIAGTGNIIDDQSLQDGITLARWFAEEMVRIAPEAGADEVAQAAGILSRALWDASVDPDGQGRNQNGTVSISVAVKNRRGAPGA